MSLEHTFSADAVVSFADEPLILVDSEDRVLGYESKAACHRGEGLLHRAFSIFVFNDEGHVLLQRRSEEKPLWPRYWSNSCCSHPRRGETDLEAAQRRVREELAVSPDLVYLYRFEYHAPFGAIGAERELCSVYVARSGEPVEVNRHEVAEWKYMPPEQVDRELREHPDNYTPWMKLEWPRIREEFWGKVEELFAATAL